MMNHYANDHIRRLSSGVFRLFVTLDRPARYVLSAVFAGSASSSVSSSPLSDSLSLELLLAASCPGDVEREPAAAKTTGLNGCICTLPIASGISPCLKMMDDERTRRQLALRDQCRRV
jgi:hypothetical protein